MDVCLLGLVEGNLASVLHAVEDWQLVGRETADDGEGRAFARPVLDDETLEDATDDDVGVGHGERHHVLAVDFRGDEADGRDVAASVLVVCFLQAPARVGLPFEGYQFSSLAILLVSARVPHSEHAVGCRFDFD